MYIRYKNLHLNHNNFTTSKKVSSTSTLKCLKEFPSGKKTNWAKLLKMKLLLKSESCSNKKAKNIVVDPECYPIL